MSGEGKCYNCGHSTAKGGHFVPPCFGDPGRFICEWCCDECRAAANAAANELSASSSPHTRTP